MPANKGHTHKYIKVSGPHTYVWKCADMDCKHYIHGAQEYTILGRATLCWECDEKFPIDEDALKSGRPICPSCKNGENTTKLLDYLTQSTRGE